MTAIIAIGTRRATWTTNTATVTTRAAAMTTGTAAAAKARRRRPATRWSRRAMAALRPYRHRRAHRVRRLSPNLSLSRSRNRNRRCR